MPPKNKKQLEEQAKRLQEEQRLRQEEQARQQLQRKKYASEELQTGLILPVSIQLIQDFPNKQISFIQAKLKEVLSVMHPNLTDARIIKQIIKQLAYYIKNLRSSFLQILDGSGQSNSSLLKSRVIIGILLEVYFNEHKAIQGNGKNKKADQNLFKNLLLAHSNPSQKLKVFQKKDIAFVLQFAKQNYFNHFSIIHKFNNFKKREDQIVSSIYVSAPTIELNNKHTTFVDLRPKQKEESEVSKVHE